MFPSLSIHKNQILRAISVRAKRDLNIILALFLYRLDSPPFKRHKTVSLRDCLIDHLNFSPERIRCIKMKQIHGFTMQWHNEKRMANWVNIVKPKLQFGIELGKKRRINWKAIKGSQHNAKAKAITTDIFSRFLFFFLRRWVAVVERADPILCFRSFNRIIVWSMHTVISGTIRTVTSNAV